jgi:hypothetical protein
MKVKKAEPLVKSKDVFKITSKNYKNYEIDKDCYLRKNRLSTVVHLDSKGIVIEVEGENPKNIKINDNIYDI